MQIVSDAQVARVTAQARVRERLDAGVRDGAAEERERELDGVLKTVSRGSVVLTVIINQFLRRKRGLVRRSEMPRRHVAGRASCTVVSASASTFMFSFVFVFSFVFSFARSCSCSHSRSCSRSRSRSLSALAGRAAVRARTGGPLRGLFCWVAPRASALSRRAGRRPVGSKFGFSCFCHTNHLDFSETHSG